MTTIADLPPGTRCLVDIVAMERDGPLKPRPCGCPFASERRAALRRVAEQVVIVLDGIFIWVCPVCGHEGIADEDEVAVEANSGDPDTVGYLINPKYLIPLPEEAP